MIDHRIRLRHLRYFLETARRGSQSATTDALNISQPAASKSIRDLEAILGLSPFYCTSRRLSLSPAGKIYQQTKYPFAKLFESLLLQFLILL